MDHGLYRIYADNIPIFNGDQHILPSFIRASEELITSFQDANDPRNPINKCIISTIISKLRGHAANIICPRNELNTWSLIKQTLKNTFDDGRNVDCLMNDLMSTTPNKNETLTQFGLKLQTLRSLLISKLNESDETTSAKLVKINYFEQITLKTYINNLPERIQLLAKCRDPKTIEEAINIVKSEEADIEFKQRTQNKFPKPNSTPINKPIPRPMFFRPPVTHPFTQINQSPFGQPIMPHYSQYQTQYRPPFQTNNNSFPSNMQNNLQRPPFMPRFQNNSPHHNNFNAFKPNSAVAKNLPKPTPMELGSDNTKLHQNKNFKTRDLFTQVVENPVSEDYTANPDIDQQNSYANYSNDQGQYDDQNNYETTPDYAEIYNPYSIQSSYEYSYYQPPTTEINPEQNENFPQVPSNNAVT